MINQLRNPGVALALGAVLASAANANDWNGWYAGVQLNSTRVTVENSGAGEEDLAGLASTVLFIGYNYNFGRGIVAGGEGGFSFQKSSTDDARSGGDRDTFGLSNELSMRVRGGYDLRWHSPNALLAYGAIGLTNIATNVTNSNTGEDLDDASISGITYGIGVETGFARDLSARVEYTAGSIRRLSLGVSYQF